MRNILRKLKKWMNRRIKAFRCVGLKGKDFSIIANNCTGGYVYQYFGLKYNTPTIGCFFETKDYIKFCASLKYYLTQELVFIDYSESKNKELLEGSNRWGEYPVAKLDDIEIYFMHYKSKEEAQAKWKRRISRLNFNRLCYMYCENEDCKIEDIKAFCALDNVKTYCFTYNKYDVHSSIYSEEVANLEEHAWKPKIVVNLVNWKEELNKLKIEE